MKKTLILLLGIVMLLNFCACSKNDIETDTSSKYEPVLLAPNGDYKHELFDNCVIMGGSVNNYTLSYNDKIICEGSFYKYCAFDNRYVAIHYMDLNIATDIDNDTIKFSASTVQINKNCFMIFDSENQSITEFENIEAFNKECHEKNLNFEDWYYRQNKSKKIQFSDSCYIEDAGNYRGQVLYYNDSPVFEGIISSCEYSNGYLSFEFKIVDSDFGPEFTKRTNQSLNFKNFQSSKKYHVEGILFFNVTYEAYIVFDTNTGTFTEYKDKNDIKFN